MELTEMEQLDRLERMTHDDGTVDVEIVNFYRRDNNAVFEFITPNGDIKKNVSDWPESADERYSAVRVANRYCGGLTGLDDLDEMPVTARADPSEWTIIAPKKRTLVGRFTNNFSFILEKDFLIFLALLTVLQPVIAIIYGILTHLEYVTPIHKSFFLLWLLLPFIGFIILAELDAKLYGDN